MLTDVAYYLIFFAYILFTVSFEPRDGWADTVNAAQLQFETARIAGILLIIGVLHGVNLLTLPVMGRLLTLNRRLDESAPPVGRSGTDPCSSCSPALALAVLATGGRRRRRSASTVRLRRRAGRRGRRQPDDRPARRR